MKRVLWAISRRQPVPDRLRSSCARPRPGRQLSLLLVAWGVLCLAACTPVVQQLAPASGDPALTPAHLIGDDAARLPLHVWPATLAEEQAVLIALHGFNDYGLFVADLATFLSERGVTTYAYDQRGFGTAPGVGIWAGERRLQQDLVVLVRLLSRRHVGVPLYLLGESMGGAVVLTVLADWPQAPVAGVILSSPAVWGYSTWPWYQRWALRAGAYTLPWLRVSGEGLDIQASDNREMLRRLGRDPLIIKQTRLDSLWGLGHLMDTALDDAPALRFPALILYGEQDEIIPCRQTARWIANLPAAWRDDQRLVLYPRGYHMLTRDLDAERVWLDIAAWLADPRGPLPSAADLDARARLREHARRTDSAACKPISRPSS